MKTKLEATTQKSYYGKAWIVKEGDINLNPNAKASLLSYDTIVCDYDPMTGEFNRLWGGYSRTTANHINDFRAMYGLEPLNKKAWEALPVKNDSGERYRVEYGNGFFTAKAGVVFDDYDSAEQFAGDIEKTHGGRVFAYPVEA